MLNIQVMGFPPGKIVIFCSQSSAIFLTVSFTSRDQRKYLKIGFVLSNKSFEILVFSATTSLIGDIREIEFYSVSEGFSELSSTWSCLKFNA